jgi:hypothetical protein
MEYSDLENWKRGIIDKYNNMRSTNISHPVFTYWYLEEVSCVPVYRNQEWFYSIIPELVSFWEDVKKFRQLGVEACKSHIKQLKEDRKLAKQREKENKKMDNNMNNYVEVDTIVQKDTTKKGMTEEMLAKISRSKCLFSEDDFDTIKNATNEDDGLHYTGLVQNESMEFNFKKTVYSTNNLKLNPNKCLFDDNEEVTTTTTTTTTTISDIKYNTNDVEERKTLKRKKEKINICLFD